MWRCHTNESHYSDAAIVAWEFVLPYYHIPILDSDIQSVKKLATFLEKEIDTLALRKAAVRIKRTARKSYTS